MICEICNEEFKSKRILANHITKQHKEISLKEYTIKYFYNNRVPICKCGCNGKLTFISLGKFRKFISGHNTKLRNKAYILPNENKIWWQDVYKKRYDENGKWNNPRNQGLIEKVCRNCGNTFYVKATQKKKIFCKKECYGQYKTKSIQNLTKDGIKFSAGCSKGGANSHPGWKNTTPERKFKKHLLDNNINFEQQKKIKTNDNKYMSVDFYIKDFNTIFEIDGDYWHANPNKYDKNYYNQKVKLTAKQIWEKDNIRNKKLKKLGYNLIRIYESDLDNYINKNTIIGEKIMNEKTKIKGDKIWNV